LKQKEMISSKSFIVTGAIYGVLGVLLGAMASHALKSILPENLMLSFNTGVRYQMYHALALLAIAPGLPLIKKSLVTWIYYLLTIGTLFFSGSIYLLSMGPIFELNTTFLGPITPIGGVLLISGWFLIVLGAVLENKD
jgi:uncharacterized membrane protein YgdD (TMEM256/DUF423 family)